MKKFFMLMILVSGLVFPWACSDNNTPSKPPNLTVTTPSGTITPGTPTNTPTLAAGANTYTPTPTFALGVPAFKANFATSAHPLGMVQNGGILTVAEHAVTQGGIVSVMEEYTGTGTASLNLYNCCPTGSGPYPNVGNIILTGCPPIQTPGATPVPFVPVTTALQGIQGFVNPGGDAGAGAWSAVLDANSSGGANLYAGYISSWSAPGVGLDHTYMPYISTGYQGIPFNNPQGMTADTTGGSGNIYIADTGNGFVDDLSPYEGTCPLYALPIHRWNGAAGVTVGGPIPSLGGGSITFKTPSVAFKSPYALACDVNGNVWVGDPGYSPSYIMQFAAGSTIVFESWKGIPGCIVHGIAVDNSTKCTGALGAGPCVYVADSGNNLVEIYSYDGNLEAEFGDPGPAANEVAAFSPSCIAFSGTYIYVGDTGNDFIDVFQ